MEMSVTEVAAKAKKAVEAVKKEDLKEQKEEAKEDVRQAKEELKLEKKMAKKEAKALKKSNPADLKKPVIPQDAFADSQPNKTYSRDPQKVSKDLEEEEKLKKSIKKINSNIDESKKALEKHTTHVKELKELV